MCGKTFYELAVGGDPSCSAVKRDFTGSMKPALRVLSLDTSTTRGSIALLEGRELAAELRVLSPETHSARLLASVDFLLKSAGWSLSDLQLVAAGIGPGSFTGIRIGVATALGLAQTLSIPFAGVSGLDALAHKISMVDGRLTVVMDAQRSQVYYAEYLIRQGRVRRLSGPTLLYPSDLLPRLRGRSQYLVGDGAVRYARELGLKGQKGHRMLRADLFLAAALGRLALTHKRSWRSGEFLQSEPLYVRPPDAVVRKAIGR